MAFRDFLERIFEPQLDDTQFVGHYVPALKYKKTQKPILYTLEIKDETFLNDYRIINNYTQELQVKLNYKVDNEYNFEIDTINNQFNLDKSLIQQGKLLESLAQLTEHVTLKVTEKGSIKSMDYKHLIKKWDTLKEKLLKTYQGNQVKGYIDGIDMKMKNETLLLEEIKQVKIFGLLFNNYQVTHEKDKPRFCKIGNLIHCLPVTFKETIKEIRENKDLEEKHITISGTMRDLGTDIENRIQKYFTYFGVDNAPIRVSSYKRDIVIGTDIGYPKSVVLNVELTNNKGYNRKQYYNLKMKSNG